MGIFKLLIFILVLGVIGLIASYTRIIYRGNMGVNVGEKHLRENWGIEEHKEYHE